MKAKVFLKSQFQKYVFGHKDSIIIASSGRAGSTVLTESISKSLPTQSYFLSLIQHQRPSLFTSFEDTLSSAMHSPSPIVKTHSLYDYTADSTCKIIYIFGDPFESALSVWSLLKTRGRRWVQNHLNHLHSDALIQDLFLVDALQYQKQIESWIKHPNALIIHYSELWLATERISEYLGFPLTLPAKTNRKVKLVPSTVNKDLFIKLRHLENTLYKKSYH